jgi:hypothetical protein
MKLRLRGVQGNRLAAGVVLAVIGVLGGMAYARQDHAAPTTPPEVRGPPSSPGNPDLSPVVSSDAVSRATADARKLPALSRVIGNGHGAVAQASPASMSPQDAPTDGVVLRFHFSSPVALSSDFPLTLWPSAATQVTGIRHIEATNVSDLLVAVDLRTDEVVNVLVDPSDVAASVRETSNIPASDQGGD